MFRTSFSYRLARLGSPVMNPAPAERYLRSFVLRIDTNSDFAMALSDESLKRLNRSKSYTYKSQCTMSPRVHHPRHPSLFSYLLILIILFLHNAILKPNNIGNLPQRCFRPPYNKLWLSCLVQEEISKPLSLAKAGQSSFR